jgi:FMN phosphatase YigB (HAD superfamily)
LHAVPVVRRLLALVLACTLLAACRVDADVAVHVDDDGSGTVQVAVTFDADAAAQVPDLAGALRIDDLQATGWTVTGPDTQPDGHVVVRAEKPFASADQLPVVLAEVSDVFRDTHLERDRSFGKLTWTFDGRVDVTGGAERFGDEQLAALLGGRPLGRDVATIEQHAGAPVADTTGLGLTVALPGGTTEHWDVRLDQSAPLPVHAEGSVERGAARLWAAIAVVAAGLAVLLVVVALLRRGRRRPTSRRTARRDPAPAPVPAAGGAAPPAAAAPSPGWSSAGAPREPRRLELVVTAAHGVLWESQVHAEEWLRGVVALQGGDVDAARVQALLREAMVGRIASAELWRALGVRGDAAELDAAYAARFTLGADVVDFVSALRRRGVAVAGVANDVAEWSTLVRGRFGLGDVIDPFVVSAEVGALVPSPSLFEEVAARAGVPLANCLYIDVDVTTLDVARDLGLSTVLLGGGASAGAGEPADHAVAADLRELLLRPSARART